MSIPHIPHWQHMHVLCVYVCVCASLSGDVCVMSFCTNFSVLSQVHASVCMCDKPHAWGLLSSPQFSKLHKWLRVTQAWAMGSPCWQPLELTVWGGATEETAVSSAS